MAAETQYTANTGMVTISTANTNLDGTGTLSAAIITGASNGTLIKTVTVKAQSTISEQGTVRLFVYDGTNTKLITEIGISSKTQSSTDPAFEISVPVDFNLKSGWSLKASTAKNQTFNVIVEGLDWAYYTTSVRQESSYYTAKVGMATLTTANTNLDGTGALTDIITAASNGTHIQSVTVKSQVTTTQGMIRLFLYDGSNSKLLTEIRVPALAKSTTVNSFSASIDFSGRGFALESGWKLQATTQISETFNVIADGLDWVYPS